MSKSFRFWVRCHTVAMLCGVLVVNPVWAGRGLRSMCGHHHQRAANCCPVVVCDPCCVPSAPVIGSPSATDCCGEVISAAPTPYNGESAAIGQIVHPAEGTLVPSAGQSSTQPLQPAPVQPGAPASPSDAQAAQATAPQPTPPAPERRVPGTPPPVTPASPFEQPATPEPAPAPETPAPTTPAPAAETPAPETPAPANPTPEPETPAPADDLFGTPPPSTEVQPAEPAANDPFSQPPAAPAEEAPAEPAASDPFGTPPAAPAEETPAEETPAEETPAEPAANDPFGTPPAATETPTSATEAPAGSDPFAAPAAAPAAEEDKPAEPAANDPFGAPPAEEKQSDDKGAGANGAASDLFGALDQNEPAAAQSDFTELLTSPAANESAPAAAEKPTEAAAAVDASASLELTPSAPTATVTESPESNDPLASTPIRKWLDNTGTFEVTGRLVVVLPDQVRLLKDNGRFATVPLRRLSDEDRRYVEETLASIDSRAGKFITAN